MTISAGIPGYRAISIVFVKRDILFPVSREIYLPSSSHFVNIILMSFAYREQINYVNFLLFSFYRLWRSLNVIKLYRVMTMALGERLKLLRKEKNLSQRNMAKLLKMGYSTLGMYETDKRSPDYPTLHRLADFFNVSVDYLLGRTNNPDGFKGKYLTVDDITAPQSVKSELNKYFKYFIALDEAIEADLSPEETHELIKIAKSIRKKYR